ncbi:hypothetical protein N431DRAFT_482029 [Stipitochalara longipes BDJ]|nr:hypothetical protein N431DRAFT_482029 [Stipitochalara longipes BDJ]
MVDLEAQAEVEAQGPNARNIVMSRNKLRKLVKMLAYSVEILQSTIELDNQIRQEEFNIETQGLGLKINSNSAGKVIEIETAKSPDLKDKQSAARVTVVPQEELARKKAQKLITFEEKRVSKGISKAMAIDPWMALKYLDWSFYTSIYTVAESRGNAVPGQQTPRIINYYSEHPDLRITVQKEIFYGLSRWWWEQGWSHTWPASESNLRERGILDMSPLVALIGMRLPHYENGEQVDDARYCLGSGLRGIRRLSILILLLELPISSVESDEYDLTKEGAFWGDKLTVGQVLDQCYGHGILEQPIITDHVTYRKHVGEITHALELINLWHFINFHGCPSTLNSVDEMRNTKISDICEWFHDHEEYGPHQPKSDCSSFQCHEMSLELLQRVGKLKLEWTEFIDEHLLLSVEDSTLKIFWFGFTVMASPMFHLGCQKYGFRYCHDSHSAQGPIFDELSETYSLLFRSHKDTYQDNLAQYGLLPVPQWLRVCYGDDNGVLPLRMAKNMSYFLQPNRPRVSDIEYHLAGVKNKLPPTQLFEKYIIWGDRLRELKAYMDSQKPGGIRGLWADKRDSLQWYTFWAVIIVGGFSLILSFMGLIVSVVQTVGTFKGVH